MEYTYGYLSSSDSTSSNMTEFSMHNECCDIKHSIKDIKVIHSYSKRYDATTDVVIVKFKDGKYEKCVRRFDEDYPFSLELGIGLCIAKHECGGSSNFYNAVKSGVKFYNNTIQKKEDAVKRKEENRKKNELQHRHKEEIKKQERKSRIDEMSDAFLRAFQKYENYKNVKEDNYD